jgi:hypothetical protein
VSVWELGAKWKIEGCSDTQWIVEEAEWEVSLFIGP